MARSPRILIPILLFAAARASALALPDTGQDTCYNDSAADTVMASASSSITRDTGTHPRQDCRYGPDAAESVGMAAKVGAGIKGFDYTKIANNGSALAATAVLGTATTAWACTRDNMTGLTWEVKTGANTDVRYSGHNYAWLDSNSATNGGTVGFPGGNSCSSTLPGGQCNTQALVTAVNSAALCTYPDWRMPTRRELLTLVYADGSSPAIVTAYFPNTSGTIYWSASPVAASPTSAWYVDFNSAASVYNIGKNNSLAVRLVRGSQF